MPVLSWANPATKGLRPPYFRFQIISDAAVPRIAPPECVSRSPPVVVGAFLYLLEVQAALGTTITAVQTNSTGPGIPDLIIANKAGVAAREDGLPIKR